MAKHKKYTYPQIVKIVGYKVVNKWDTGQITLGQFMKIFDKKLQEVSRITKKDLEDLKIDKSKPIQIIKEESK